MRKNYSKFNKPQKNGWNNKIMFTVLGIWMIVAGLILYILSFSLPWFALYIQFCAKGSIFLGLVFLAPAIWKLLCNAFQFFLFNWKGSNKQDLSCLLTEQFKQLLFSMNLYAPDPYDLNKVRLP